MFQLICRDPSGSVAFPAEKIEGLPVPARRYSIQDSVVTLDGYADAVLHHDLDVLLAMPNGLYRLPAPEEQNAKAEEARKAATAEESAPEQKPSKKVSG